MENRPSSRAGRYVSQPTGYRAFIPGDLPPSPSITVDDEMLALLSQADRALGRLDGSTEILPNPDLFVAMYVRKEAVLSSQIEGTQASLLDVLEFEAKSLEPGRPRDVGEVVNYVGAMNHGLERLKEFPLSLRLIREIHEKLLSGVRGGIGFSDIRSTPSSADALLSAQLREIPARPESDARPDESRNRPCPV